MGFTALRNIIRPLSRTLLTSASTSKTTSFSVSPLLQTQTPFTHFTRHFSIFTEPPKYDRLTDSRFPKRRPVDKPRRKRGHLRPQGPIAWLKHEPGKPVPQSNPNEGSVKRRNEKKRMRLRRAFILAEAKKRRAQLQEAKRRKNIEKVERKMAAVAREREWAQRLVELRRLEEEKKNSAA